MIDTLEPVRRIGRIGVTRTKERCECEAKGVNTLPILSSQMEYVSQQHVID